MKSLLISGDRSGAGKTSITLGISGVIAEENSVQTYKVAMDYIDTSYLAGVTKRPSYNLDSFVQTKAETQGLFSYGANGADYGVIEGVRGLYEGIDALSDTGSTASIAKMFDLPVLLVINARSITRSAAALVKGFMAFDPNVRISGVILNNVMGERHVTKAKTAIEEYCKVPVLGAVPRQTGMELSMRHLGLVPYREGGDNADFQEKIRVITDTIREYVDIDAVKALSKDVTPEKNFVAETLECLPAPEKRIAVAYDEAFNFYYGELFAVLKSLGADVVTFSPIHDKLPEADGYIFGGGYPELFPEELERNDSMREAVFEVSKNGTPIYAECGGLMYLTRGFTILDEWRNLSPGTYEMCKVFPGTAKMPVKKALGYVVGEAKLPSGNFSFRGHEFHYSGISMDSGVKYSYELSRGVGVSGGKDGVLVKNTLGAYTHLMPISSRGMFGNFFGLV